MKSAANLRVATLICSLPFAFTSLFSQELPPTSPASVGVDPARLTRLDTAMESYVNENRVSGFVTLFVRNGKVVHHASYGKLRLDTGQPMPKDAIFRIASMSKAVTSVAIMMLQEEGRLLISDPVSKYVSAFRHTTVAEPPDPGSSIPFKLVPARREITLRDLLTHTAGISYGTGLAEAAYKWDQLHGWYFADKQEPIGSAIQRLATLPFTAQPGEKWVYGFNTDILGYVVEKASGMSLSDYFEKRIFEPLKMVDTDFFLPPEKLGRFTPVYGSGEHGGLDLVEAPETSEYVLGPRLCYSGGAGLLSTARDYARFLQMLLNRGELEGARILSPHSVAAMTANHVGDLYGDQGFGLGFWIALEQGKSSELGSVGAFGRGGAYYTTFWVDPAEKLVAVLMAQLRPAREIDLHGKYRNMVYQSILGQSPPD